MSMKAVCYKGPFSVEVQDVALPSIEHPDDIVVKVTTAAICGSDSHMYEGRTGAQPGLSHHVLPRSSTDYSVPVQVLSQRKGI